MNQAFQEDLIALSLILNQDHTVSVGYSPAEIADAETASGICFPIALKTVYETVGKDSILAKGFYAPCEIRILHEPRTYCFKPFGEYIGFEFADTDGKRYAYYPFRRRDCDYKCYEKLERIYDKPHESFVNISDNRRKAPDYSGFLDLFADRIMDRMKYIITFTGKKAMNDYIAVCQGFGAEDFQTYLPHSFRGEETRHIMHPLRMQYNYALLRDVFSGETEVLTTDAKHVKISSHGYSVGGGKYHNSLPRISNYLCFSEKSVYLYSTALSPYLAACQKYDKQIEIVYHKHSGVVETIDGMRIYDENAFRNSANAMEKKAAEEQAAQEQAEKEAEEKHLEVFSAFFQSEGENYEEIVRSLAERGLENTYDTIYISTKYFEPGEIALFDNTQNVIYVCRDNDGEDMIKVPPLPLYSPLTEITKILDDAGIKWTYYCFGCKGEQEDFDHSKCILKTVHCSPGTPIPKDYVFWFSVQHVG